MSEKISEGAWMEGTFQKLRSQSFLWLTVVMALMSACGDGDGNNDTVLTGFSGVFIFGIVCYIIYRVVKKNTDE